MPKLSTPALRRIGRLAGCIFLLSIIPVFWSLKTMDSFTVATHATEVTVNSLKSFIVIRVSVPPNFSHPNHWFFDWTETPISDLHHREAPAPGWERTDYGPVTISRFKRGGVTIASTYGLILPCVELVPLYGGLFIWLICRLMTARRRARAAARECIKCGYNLTASPERCPECGTKVIPGFEPLSWREPQWSIDARRSSPVYRKKLYFSIILIAIIVAMLNVAIMLDPRRVSASSFTFYIFVNTGFLLSFGFGLVLSRRAKITIDAPHIKIGDALLLDGAALRWKKISAAGIRQDSAGRSTLWLQRGKKLIERGIAPEIDLQAVQSRLDTRYPKVPPLTPTRLPPSKHQISKDDQPKD